MSYSFDEIMAYHPDNRDIYNELRQCLPKLVPFVGAGLTQFAYCSWPAALKELSGKLTNRTDARSVEGLIRSGRYLDAAQRLEELRAPVNLARDLAELFSAEKLERARQRLGREAVALLPALFPELVLTTNFDETLEAVYRESGRAFQGVFPPGHPELLRQFLRKGNARGLFKLHGTVTGGLIEYERIVFTLAQYNRHYQKDSPLTRELKACFEQRMMLFLGCSLENDRTMELLQEIIRPGDEYLAIVGCKKNRRDEKTRQLGAKHIRAILYEKGRHEAVRVILEHLLEETNPQAYQALPVHMGALRAVCPADRFSYKAEIVPFTGRERELEALNAFLGDEGAAFRWWAVVGPGGSGKSRLAYEFQKRLPRDWSARYLRPEDYKDLSALTERLTGKTLLIADYVQEHAKAIGRWMEHLAERNRSLPLRVLLVERDAGEQEDSAWTAQLYADVHHRQAVRGACFRDAFLSLPPLSGEDLLAVIGDYALALRRSEGGLSGEKKRLLLEKLRSVDPVLCRPLYAMFLTDALVEGQDPERWDRSAILDYVTEREQTRLDFNLRHALGRADEKLYAACLYLQNMATVLQDADLETLEELCPEAWEVVCRKADAFVSPENLLEQAGLAVNGDVPALRPDLIGEYDVCTWLFRRRREAKPFLRAAWQRPKPAFVFFDRTFRDYAYLLNEDAKLWERLLPGEVPESEEAAQFYTMLLVNAVPCCSIVQERGRQMQLLEEISLKYPDNMKIITEFSRGLLNFSILLNNAQDEQGVARVIARLEKLVADYPGNPGLAIALAIGLYNLINRQNEPEAVHTLNRLEKLAAAHPNTLYIVIQLASGLVNLTSKQNEQGIAHTVDRLEKLAAAYPDVPNLAASFAFGLYNLIVYQDAAAVADTVRRLEKLTADFPDVPDIASMLARGLYKLSLNQDAAAAADTVRRLEKLAADFPDTQDIIIMVTGGLANLSKKQQGQEAEATLRRASEFITKRFDFFRVFFESP